MHSNTCLDILLGAVALAAIPVSTNAATPTDACQVLTAAQVGSAVGAKVEEGTHVSPAFTKTCTWVVKAGGVIVTLNIQELAMFKGGKGAMTGTESAGGVGDEAYYIGAGSTMGLSVRKADAAFKVSIYASKLSLEQRKSIEKTLAQQAAMKF
ncbi:MAG TPA: hypothetical protein VGM84_27225 [Steroidobacteraceae bacterium]|jgi:hypothetical protein